ncbi:MAG: dihydroxy-acid dehydratase, partial [Roseinatronobacter sp.]
VDLNTNEINCTPLNDPAILHARKANWDNEVAKNGGFHPSLPVADTRLLQRARHMAVPAIQGAGLHPNRTVWVRNPREATPSGFMPHNKFRTATHNET